MWNIGPFYISSNENDPKWTFLEKRKINVFAIEIKRFPEFESDCNTFNIRHIFESVQIRGIYEIQIIFNQTTGRKYDLPNDYPKWNQTKFVSSI